MTLKQTYGSLENVSIITLAPEKHRALEVIQQLTDSGITVAIGHSMSSLHQGELAITHGSNLITHLFNAMLPVGFAKYIRIHFYCRRKKNHLNNISMFLE